MRCKSIPSHPSSSYQLSEYNSNYFIKAFCSLTSVCIFSILFSIHSLLCWQGEFVYQSRASLVKRNAMLVTLSSQRVNIHVVQTDDIDKWKITSWWFAILITVCLTTSSFSLLFCICLCLNIRVPNHNHPVTVCWKHLSTLKGKIVSKVAVKSG